MPFCYRARHRFQGEVSRTYIENGNLVKTKMETVPLSQSFKDDRMTTWRFLRYSMQFSEHLMATSEVSNECFSTRTDCWRLIFDVIISFSNAWVKGKRRRRVLAAHASSAVHRISVSFKQARQWSHENLVFRTKQWFKALLYILRRKHTCALCIIFKFKARCTSVYLIWVAKGVIWREQNTKLGCWCLWLPIILNRSK